MVPRLVCDWACAAVILLPCRARGEGPTETRSTSDWRKQLDEWRRSIDMELARKKPPAWKITGGKEQLDALHQKVSAIREESAVPALSSLLREEPQHLLRAIWLAPCRASARSRRASCS